MSKVRELRAAIFAQNDSEAAFARSIGWTKQRLNKITSGQKTPDVNEINIIAEGLGRPVCEIVDIFLRHESPKGQQPAQER